MAPLAPTRKFSRRYCTALRRVGAPDDIADIVAFLASDEARWLTGVTLAATGGQITSATNIISYG